MIDFEFEFQYAEEKTPRAPADRREHTERALHRALRRQRLWKSTLLRSINGLIPQFYEGELKASAA